MIFIKILVPFVTLLAMASSDVRVGLFKLFLFPYNDHSSDDWGWEYCINNSADKQTYKSILDDARSCYRNLTVGNQSTCHNLEDRIPKCSQPLVDFFVDCFPEKAKDLPSAISKSVTSFVKALCTIPADLLMEVFNPCIYEYYYQRRKDIKEECKDTYFDSRIVSITNDLPSKMEACKLLQEIGDCWQYYVNQDCGGLASKDLFSKLYNAILADCK